MKLTFLLVPLFIISGQCTSFECQVKAALIVNILKFIEHTQFVNFCIPKNSHIFNLIQIAYNENKPYLKNISLKEIDPASFADSINSKECEVFFIDNTSSYILDELLKTNKLVILNGEVEGSFTIKIQLVDGKMKFIVNRTRFLKSDVKLDSSILKLAYKIIE